NEVGNPHIFTVTATAIPSGTTPTLVSIVPSVSPTPDLANSNTCGSPTVNGNVATCTITINSSSVGTFTANATATWTFADSDPGATPTTATAARSTSGNSGPGGSGPATKRFVDAFIVVTPPTATNPVNVPHTFTITFTALPGSATPTVFNSI